MDSQQNNSRAPTDPAQTARQAEMLANRVAKNHRHLKKWAKAAGVECFRIYDRDIPELPFALDLYAKRAHLQEYSRPVMDVRSQNRWLAAMHEAVATALGLRLADVVLKRRHGQRPDQQYRKLGESEQDFVVAEGGCRFIVNLHDYLDTGLFLDHRETRAMVGRSARGKRVLNLFCYTGSFSVHAALGGAASTTSVDLSNTYLDWTRRNFRLNAMPEAAHRLVHADAMRYVDEERGTGNRYDLIVLDPPSFSNSKRMDGVLDVQRDHADLIRGCLALLSSGGELVFSTNLRSFRLDAGALADVSVTDISERTLPPDFRNRRIHRCWQIRAVKT